MSSDTDIPAVCETCLGPNPYVEMLRDKDGAECKICTRPYTEFKWIPHKGGRYARTVICLTCARQKNCCQSCLNDLTYGLPLAIRDAALKMAGSQAHSASSLNAVSLTTANDKVQKQYIAQKYERDLANGVIQPPEYNNVSVEDSARELLQSLSDAMKKERNTHKDSNRGNHNSAFNGESKRSALDHDVSRLLSKLPINGSTEPPKDEKITSLFIAGIEEDLPEYKLRDYFEIQGPVKSLICVHRARAGYVTFKLRRDAEACIRSTKNGRLIISGCKLRLSWGKPRQLGSTYAEQGRIGVFIKKSLRKKD